MFIALNSRLRARRRPLALAAVLCVLALGLTLARGALGAAHVGMDPDGGMAGHGQMVLALCLALGETAVVVAVAVASLALGLHLRRAAFLLAPLVTTVPRRTPRDLRARSSPVRLQVLRH